MLAVVWETDALDSLEEITFYIAQRNASAAKRLKASIERTAEALPSHPFMYRPGGFRQRAKRSFIPIIFSCIALATSRSTYSPSFTPASNIPDTA